MSATSGVPSLSAKASASRPTMNSWTALPLLWILNVTVSPTAAWTNPGVKLRKSSAEMSTIRGAAAVPGVNASVGPGVAVGDRDGVIAGAADEASDAALAAAGAYVNAG